jgi:uncharacterized membrane protein
MFDLNAYSLVLLFHVVAATVLVGSSMFEPLVRRSLASARSVGELRLYLDIARRAAQANPVAALAVLGTGLYLGSAGWWSTGWFYVALGLWLLNSALAVAVVKRAAAALGGAVARTGDGPITADLDSLRRATGWTVAAEAMRAVDLSMLYVMFQKPSAVESCLVAAATVAAFVGLALARRRHPGRAEALSVSPALERP